MLKRSTLVVNFLLLLLVHCVGLRAQGLNSSSSLSNTPGQVERSAGQVQAVIDRAERHYKLGELSLKDRNYETARAEFDKAIDAVLESGLDVRANPRLQAYYLQLVERVHRMEFPATGAAQAAIPSAAPSPPQGVQFIAENATTDAALPRQTGFLRDQRFEPSPLDELSRLELAGEERNASDPAANAAESCQAARLEGVALRGFRLGTAEAAVRRRLPRLHVRRGLHGLGTASAFFGGRGGAAPAGLEGVTAVGFTFLDGKAARVIVGYDDSIRWKSLDEFTERTTEALRLPKRWRAYEVDDERRRGLFCGDLSLITYFAAPHAARKGPMIFLEDGAVLRSFVRRAKAVEERRRLEEERKKRAFKP